MGRCSPRCELLQHIRRVQQVRILVDTCCGSMIAPFLSSDVDFTTLSCTTGLLHSLTDKAAEATRLVLEARQILDDNSWENNAALQAVKQAVYGPAASKASLSELVFSASVEQTKTVKRCCVAMLSQSLTTPDPCFVILNAAVQAGVPCLVEQALEKVCSDFSHAAIAGSTAWADLSQEAVMLLLCSNNLQVDSEKDVLAALASWVQARPQQRTPMFEDMFVKAVRMDDMTYMEVQEIDMHPLVAKHTKAYMQVAHALLAWHIGPRHIARTATDEHATSTGHTRNHARRTRHSAVQKLPTQQQQTATPCVGAHNVQFVTDRHATGGSTESSGQMPHLGASSLQSSTDQLGWGLHGSSSQQRHVGQPSQDAHMGQISQQSALHPMGHLLNAAHQDERQRGASDQLQHQSRRLAECSDEDDQVTLSYSSDADLSCELDLQSSAVSQLVGNSSGQAASPPSDAVLRQSSGCPNVPDASQHAVAHDSQLSLVVRTQKALRLHVRSPCTTVQEEMAGSPSAAHCRKKQPRLNSTRCLKF